MLAVAGSAAGFGVVAVPWAAATGWGGAPWEVIGPVACVVAAGVLAALGWWATQVSPAEPGGGVRRVRQTARSSGGIIRQTAGNQGAGTRRRRPAREDIRQTARGDGDIDQVAGDRT
ncbi:hypothetical protein MTQ13_00550 [Streptomyces sp. XM4011]|uniref:hypothetical protein n=1 Tax=Streptomyces sp. XM4011 TaxID=2929780 RepID=UPI001FF70C5B|nr:hypothetical protein [Streptomyces sp. XM4011]MCK1812781.1 hypothetical protein [Streptomyces sp. XM4011]